MNRRTDSGAFALAAAFAVFACGAAPSVPKLLVVAPGWTIDEVRAASNVPLAFSDYAPATNSFATVKGPVMVRFGLASTPGHFAIEAPYVVNMSADSGVLRNFDLAGGMLAPENALREGRSHCDVLERANWIVKRESIIDGDSKAQMKSWLGKHGSTAWPAVCRADNPSMRVHARVYLVTIAGHEDELWRVSVEVSSSDFNYKPYQPKVGTGGK